MDRTWSGHAGPADEGPRREFEVADAIGADQRGGAAQPRAAVHREGTALGFRSAQEALEDVHGRAAAVFEGQPKVADARIFEDLWLITKQFLSFSLFFEGRMVALDDETHLVLEEERHQGLGGAHGQLLHVERSRPRARHGHSLALRANKLEQDNRSLNEYICLITVNRC